MARYYVYLLRRATDRELIGAFTIKGEAIHYARKCGKPLDTLQLSRMTDGYRQKQETEIPWEGRCAGSTPGSYRSE